MEGLELINWCELQLKEHGENALFTGKAIEKMHKLAGVTLEVKLEAKKKYKLSALMSSLINGARSAELNLQKRHKATDYSLQTDPHTVPIAGQSKK